MPEITDKRILSIPADVRKFVDVERCQSIPSSVYPVSEDLPEISLDEVADVLSSTIAKDWTTKLVTFMVLLLTYTHEDQTGILYQAGSSTGKSHNALEVTKGYFPAEDVIKKDYASPTAFFHKQTELCVRSRDDCFYPVLSKREYVNRQMQEWDKANPKPEERGEKTEHRNHRNAAKGRFADEWDSLEKVWFWDLSRRILLFKDMPHDLVLANLRPLISKDEQYFEADITDKSTSGQHATKTIVLKGFSTFLFCSASYSQDEQERTRFFLLSPEVQSEKIKAGVRMAIQRSCNRPRFEGNIRKDERRAALRERVLSIRAASITDVIIPDDLTQEIENRIFDEHDSLQPRLMRDAPRMIALMKAHALLNFSNRQQRNGIIVATERDVQVGYELYRPIAEANERGVPPQVYDFYEKRLEPSIRAKAEEDGIQGISRKDFVRLWFDEFNEQIGYKRMVEILHLMDNAGLASERENPADKREKLIYIPGGGVESAQKEAMPSAPFDRFLSWLITHGLDMRGKTVSRAEIASAWEESDEKLNDYLFKALDEEYLRETEPGVYHWGSRATKEGIVD